MFQGKPVSAQLRNHSTNSHGRSGRCNAGKQRRQGRKQSKTKRNRSQRKREQPTVTIRIDQKRIGNPVETRAGKPDAKKPAIEPGATERCRAIQNPGKPRQCHQGGGKNVEGRQHRRQHQAKAEQDQTTAPAMQQRQPLRQGFGRPGRAWISSARRHNVHADV